MKIFALIFVSVTIASAVQQETFKLPEARLQMVKKTGAECAKQHNVDPDLLYKIPDGTLPRDEAANKYLYCITLKNGLIVEDGHMVVDKLASLLGDHPRVEEFKESVRKCNEVTKENPVATAVEMNRCFTTTAPIRFLL